MTTDQEYCIDALAEWAGGEHHLPKVYEFGSGVCVNWYGGLSTFDFDRLTTLVLMAHERSVRIEIASSGPRMVKIIAHRRLPQVDGSGQQFWQKHPTLQHLKQTIEVSHPQ